MNQAPANLRVMVVDDTILYRKVVSEVLSELPGVEVVGSAHNGRVALGKIDELKPDLLTLDIEMPEMNGLEVLERLPQKAPHVGAIMLSAYTREGSEMALKALELGAFDFVPKPQSRTLQENKAALKAALDPMIRAFARLYEVRRILKFRQKADVNPLPLERPDVKAKIRAPGRPRVPHINARTKIVAIGISTGGPVALAHLLPKIPGNIGIPFLIAQHMPAVFTQSLAKNLDRRCAIAVKEAADGETIAPNTAYIAPGGCQMKVADDVFKKTQIIRITHDPPENGCAPSADYLFSSVARHYGPYATGIIMTGMGADGTLGLRNMKEKGAHVIAQDAESSVVYGMAKKAVETGVVDIVTPLSHLAAEVLRTIPKTLKVVV